LSDMLPADAKAADATSLTRWRDDCVSVSGRGAQNGSSVEANMLAGLSRVAEVNADGRHFAVGHGSVVIAAITSCTNTSNPSVMIAAGLLAEKAAARGLKAAP